MHQACGTSGLLSQLNSTLASRSMCFVGCNSIVVEPVGLNVGLRYRAEDSILSLYLVWFWFWDKSSSAFDIRRLSSLCDPLAGISSVSVTKTMQTATPMTDAKPLTGNKEH